MGMRDEIMKKLSQATCDKIELNRKILRICRCLKEAAKELDGSHKKQEKSKGDKRDH